MTRESLAALGVFTLVATLGFDSGGYAATAWGWSAIAVFAVLAILVARGMGRPGRAALVFVGAFAALAIWIAASLLWSSHVSATVLEVQRALVYVGAAALFVLAGRGRGLLAGVLGAATLLCGYGLVNWLLGNPEVPASADPQAAERLSEPIGYANGVAILAAMGLLLSLGFAARASRAPAAAAAAATAPLFAATLYFTFGRGAWLALAVGLGVAVAIGPGRLQLAATALAIAVPAALAVVAADLLGASGWLAPVVLLLSALAAAVPYVLRSAEARYHPSPRARQAFAAVLIALPVLAVAAVLVRLGGPAEAYDSFKAAPAPTHGDVQGRVFSLSGSNRADYWRVAWRVYEDHPALGAGAGTYSRSWLRERPVPQPVQDAHSLYLETLAELGPIGLALLLVALAAPFAAPRSWWTPVALGSVRRVSRPRRAGLGLGAAGRHGRCACLRGGADHLVRRPAHTALPRNPARRALPSRCARVPRQPGGRRGAVGLRPQCLAGRRGRCPLRPFPPTVVARALAPARRGAARPGRACSRSEQLPEGSGRGSRRVGAVARPGPRERGRGAPPCLRAGSALEPAQPRTGGARVQIRIGGYTRPVLPSRGAAAGDSTEEEVRQE